MLLSPREIKEITDNEKTPVEHGNIYDQIIEDTILLLNFSTTLAHFFSTTVVLIDFNIISFNPGVVVISAGAVS